MKSITYIFNLLFKYGTAFLFAVSIMNTSTVLLEQINSLALFQLLYSIVFLIAVLKIETKVSSDIQTSTLFIVIFHLTLPLLMTIDQSSTFSSSIAVLFMGSLGSLIALYSLFDLGKSFYILPVNSQIKVNGMYSFIRHPIYLGYILVVFSRFVSSATLINFVIMLLFIIITILRIFKEENLLKQNSEYLNYIKSVRFRIIPWVY